MNFFAVFKAPDPELLLITRAAFEEMMPLPFLPALMIALRFEPLPEAKTHKFKANLYGILLIMSKNS